MPANEAKAALSLGLWMAFLLFSETLVRTLALGFSASFALKVWYQTIGAEATPPHARPDAISAWWTGCAIIAALTEKASLARFGGRYAIGAVSIGNNAANATYAFRLFRLVANSALGAG
mgnify:CR=1 FL=1